MMMRASDERTVRAVMHTTAARAVRHQVNHRQRIADLVCVMTSEPLDLHSASRPSLICCTAVAAPALPSRTDAAGWWRAPYLQLRAAVTSWRARRAQRSQLARIDPWTQRDLGLTDAEIWRELQKYPWQP